MRETLQELFAGNDRHAEAVCDSFDGIQDAQRPECVTVSCGDSRVLQDEMWDNKQPGHIFTHSNIGNRVVEEIDAGHVVTGDVLYPLVHTETETAVVVGHTGCGAVTAAYLDLVEGIEEPPGIEYCVNLLEAHLERGVEMLPESCDQAEAVNKLVEYNVDKQVEYLVESDDVSESVTAVGVVYDFQDVYTPQRGVVHLINVDGVRDPEQLRQEYPEFAKRVQRLWEY